MRDALAGWLDAHLAPSAAKKSALETLENDPANHKFTAQTLADQEAMRADVAAKKTSPRK
jgi:hypothetical protein